MKVFKSKVSRGLWISVFGVLVTTMILPFLFGGNLGKEIIVMCAIILPVIGFMAHLYFNTNYTIDKQATLRIRCGFLSSPRVKIIDIKSIKKTKSIISAPALSLDRIEISFGKYDSVIISPENEDEFIQKLLSINPKIKYDLE